MEAVLKLKMNACDEVNHGGERYGFARVRHVADPDAKQKSPDFSNTWTSSFSGAVPAMAYGEFWRIGRGRIKTSDQKELLEFHSSRPGLIGSDHGRNLGSI
jgi:hypothetical protein